MTCKFVVRLLDAAGRLLAWEQLFLTPESGGRFVAPAPTRFVVEASGTATRIAIHWTDLDVARLAPVVAAFDVATGQVLDFAWAEPVWHVCGDVDVPLPGVTLRASVTIGVPAGSMGTRGN